LRLVSRILSVAFVLLLIFSTSVSAISDNALWEDSEVYNLFSEGKSNSSLTYAVAKVKYDYSSNRIHILFMSSFDSFTDENNVGVELEFNDLGPILLMADGTAEYDDDIYFAEIDDIMSDSRTATVYIETTVGIKKGIPAELIMTSTIIDTEGVRSNEFSTDISDVNFEENTEEEEDEKTSKTKTTKAKTTKTTKAKTTKVKTTKVKTTKTTKAKTTKSKKSTTNKITEEESEKSYASLNNKLMNSKISGNSSGKKTIAFAVVGIAVCFIIAGCIAGIKKSGKPKH